MKKIWDEQATSSATTARSAARTSRSSRSSTTALTHMTRVHTYTTEGRRKPDVDPATVTPAAVRAEPPGDPRGLRPAPRSAQDIDKWVKTFLDDSISASSPTTRSSSSRATTQACSHGKRFSVRSGLASAAARVRAAEVAEAGGITPGTRLQNLVGFEDLAPTVLTLAGVARTPVHAGSFVPRAEAPKQRDPVRIPHEHRPALTTRSGRRQRRSIQIHPCRTRRISRSAFASRTSGRCRGRWRGTRRITRARSTRSSAASSSPSRSSSCSISRPIRGR